MRDFRRRLKLFFGLDPDEPGHVILSVEEKQWWRERRVRPRMEATIVGGAASAILMAMSDFGHGIYHQQITFFSALASVLFGAAAAMSYYASRQTRAIRAKRFRESILREPDPELPKLK